MTFQPQPVGHLTLRLAQRVGNLIRHFKKSQMPAGLPGGGGGGGGGMIAFRIDRDITRAAR